MNKEFLIKKLKEQKFPDKIVGAFKNIERKEFVPKNLASVSYKDIPLPIGQGQTISQPYTLAFMLMLLDLKDKQKILEVGSGSGYALALIDEIIKNSELYGLERIEELFKKSQESLKKIGKKHINLFLGSDFKRLKGKAPFDRILVSAAAEKIPQELVNQLQIGGVLVAPVRNSIIVVKKKSGRNEIKEFPGFSFVPLIRD